MPAAANEMNRTPRRPKYSLMTSVMMNTIGQTRTPAVKLSDPCCPNRFQPNGGRPSVDSSAKIFTPTNSATIALPTKKAVNATKSRVGRESNEALTISGPAPS